ncbi:MAG: SDR family oxidoreductase [Gammaproteobacteria bacterium]|nr:SDR family oxidoreductase [Gammaproteobacteria bacterium]
MRGLKDKAAVIAGGGSGIGAATARRLAEEGAQLVIGDLSANAARAVSRSIEAAGGRAIGLAFDVRDAGSVAPGFTLTEEIDRQLDPGLRAEFVAGVRGRRLVSPEDVAAAVAFLLSEDAASINGQVISVDGGRTMRP